MLLIINSTEVFAQKHTKKRSTCARFTYVYKYRLPPHIKCGFSGVRRKNRAILLLSIVKEQYSLSPFVGYEGLSSAVSNKSCVSGCWRKRSSPPSTTTTSPWTPWWGRWPAGPSSSSWLTSPKRWCATLPPPQHITTNSSDVGHFTVVVVRLVSILCTSSSTWPSCGPASSSYYYARPDLAILVFTYPQSM